jgi:REP element-mobilizing transposase RayT/DNA-binding transcriptional regulator YiaG
MPRRRRGQTDCRLHHITCRGNSGRSMFADAVDRERYYDLLDAGVATYEIECHQDVQMGNHVHLLLEGRMADVSKLLWFVSHRYARTYNARHGEENHLHGRRFHASEVPDKRAARAVAVYIAMNPVRAGLCSHPLDWEYGSYRAHVTDEPPRPHLSTNYTRELFVARTIGFEAAIDVALNRKQGGRPPLGALLPKAERLTPEHVRHIREIYGYTVDEIAGHYGRTARTMKRWLSVPTSRA